MMLACVCQPSDVGIFRRSPVPLGAPPLQIQGAIPKLGRIIQNPSSSVVITSEPNTRVNSHKVNKKSKSNLNKISKKVNNVTTQAATLSSSSSLSENLSLSISNDSNDKASNVKPSPTEDASATSNSKSIASLLNVQVLVTKSDTPKTFSSTNIKSTDANQLMNSNNLKILSDPWEQSEDKSVICDSRNAKTSDRKPHHRKTNGIELPEGVQLTLSELREMACRQQAQIDSQHQLLAAKEQRLRYLKDQEARQQRVQAETERLRRLRDRVDAQELKLRKLRALRGQVDHHKQNNISLTSDLESIRALFNEKEKELSLAVAKVEELTRQLEELRRGRSRDQAPLASALELDKLRRELMYRNKLNEQQNQRLNQQREALTARQEEMSSIDKRISELQERLHRKRLLNQQLATQISAASNKAAYHQLVRLTGSQDQSNQFYGRKPPQQANNQVHNGLSRGNIATVEPYNHVPLPNGHQIKIHHGGNQENATYHPVYQQNHHIINTKADSDQQNAQDQQNVQDNNKISSHYGIRTEENDVLKEFSVSKSDPKYQTLPYNTKFTVSLIPNKVNSRLNENNDNNVNNSETKDIEPIQHISNNGNTNIQSQHMTVHSAPLNIINKNIATPLNQNDLINRKNTEHIIKEQNLNTIHNYNNNNQNHLNGDLKPQNTTKHQSSDHPNSTSNNSSSPSYQKPVSSVAPTSIHHSGKFSNIYQTSSIKVQPVEPQTVTNNHKQLPAIPQNTQPSNLQSPQQLALSPPQANSTPVGTPENQADKLRPALPPKPAIKPPPRQTQANLEDEHGVPPPVPLTEPPDDGKSIANQFPGNTNHRNIPQPPPVYSQNKASSAYNQITLNHKNGTNSQHSAIPTSQTQTNNNSQITSINQQNTTTQSSSINHPIENMPIIKAKPLTIKKQPLGEQPKLRTVSSVTKLNGLISNNRRIEIPPAFNFAEINTSEKPSDSNTGDQEATKEKSIDETDRIAVPSEETDVKDKEEFKHVNDNVIRRCKKGNLKQTGKANLSRRVSFDPLALLLDASLEGELELVRKTAGQVPNPSAANDEGITALHNAICAGHFEIVKFLVEFGCDVNAQDSDGWTPLHCAASCNNVAMVKFLVEHGACIFATTLSDHETAAEKCEEDEEGFDGCSEYLYSVQEKLGILSGGAVYAVFDYTAQQPDELSFSAGQQLTVLRKGDESEREWWWSRLDDKEGYVPRNLLGLYPRVSPHED